MRNDMKVGSERKKWKRKQRNREERTWKVEMEKDKSQFGKMEWRQRR